MQFQSCSYCVYSPRDKVLHFSQQHFLYSAFPFASGSWCITLTVYHSGKCFPIIFMYSFVHPSGLICILSQSLSQGAKKLILSHACVAPREHSTRQDMTTSKAVARLIGAQGRPCSTGLVSPPAEDLSRPSSLCSWSRREGDGEEWGTFFLSRVVSLFCVFNHTHVCMHTQTQIIPEFSEFFEKGFVNNGTLFQVLLA